MWGNYSEVLHGCINQKQNILRTLFEELDAKEMSSSCHLCYTPVIPAGVEIMRKNYTKNEQGK